MVALVQRVRSASVVVAGETVGSVGQGLLLLLGVRRDDTEHEAAWLARKCAGLRIFGDAEGKMNLSIKDIEGEVLVVSQFTLYGDVERGNRPSFEKAAGPEQAERLYKNFVDLLDEEIGTAVQTGIFGAMMDVHLINDGPVTIWIERENDRQTT
ncbi:MAG: D-aminoacyl-tRNA deacylase [Rhodothermales bacterium]